MASHKSDDARSQGKLNWDRQAKKGKKKRFEGLNHGGKGDGTFSLFLSFQNHKPKRGKL
jgi:hypothetical protein